MPIAIAGYKHNHNDFSKRYVNLPKAQFSIYVDYCFWTKLANWPVIKRKLGLYEASKCK